MTKNKLNFRLLYGPFGPTLGSPTFLVYFISLLMLGFVASYFRMQFLRKRIIQTQENCQKTLFWT